MTSVLASVAIGVGGGNALADRCEMTGEWIDPAPKAAPPPETKPAPPKDTKPAKPAPPKPALPPKPAPPKDDKPKEIRSAFVFTADYKVPRQGAHEFTGRYINPTNKDAADVKGLQTDGTWIITLTFTNDASKGQTIKAIGEGQYQPPSVGITGTYKLTDSTAKVMKEGKFTLNGTCTK